MANKQTTLERMFRETFKDAIAEAPDPQKGKGKAFFVGITVSRELLADAGVNVGRGRTFYVRTIWKRTERVCRTCGHREWGRWRMASAIVLVGRKRRILCSLPWGEVAETPVGETDGRQKRD